MLIRYAQAAESMQPPVAKIVAQKEVAEAGSRGGLGMHPFKSSRSAARHCFFDGAFQELYAAVSTGLKKILGAAVIKVYSRCLLL
jgi:hypothetical protein